VSFSDGIGNWARRRVLIHIEDQHLGIRCRGEVEDGFIGNGSAVARGKLLAVQAGIALCNLNPGPASVA